MKELHLDLETRSSVDISKGGVYRYASSSDFAILLLGYSIDGGDVAVIDLASEETVPEEVLRAIVDDRVTKWAHNSSFERVALWMRFTARSMLKGGSRKSLMPLCRQSS